MAKEHLSAQGGPEKSKPLSLIIVKSN